MEEDVNSVKIANLEKQMDELKEGNKLINSNVGLIITANSNNQLHFDNVFKLLDNIGNGQIKMQNSLDANNQATKETENKVNNLTTKTNLLAVDLDDAKVQIASMQNAPAKNFTSVAKTILIYAICVCVGALIAKYIPK